MSAVNPQHDGLQGQGKLRWISQPKTNREVRFSGVRLDEFLSLQIINVNPLHHRGPLKFHAFSTGLSRLFSSGCLAFHYFHLFIDSLDAVSGHPSGDCSFLRLIPNCEKGQTTNKNEHPGQKYVELVPLVLSSGANVVNEDVLWFIRVCWCRVLPLVAR